MNMETLRKARDLSLLWGQRLREIEDLEQFIRSCHREQEGKDEEYSKGVILCKGVHEGHQIDLTYKQALTMAEELLGSKHCQLRNVKGRITALS